MIFNVSPHVLMDVRSCAMRGWTRHVMGYTSVNDSIKAAAGSAYHAGMAVFLDPNLTETGPERRARALAALHAKYDAVWEKCPADKLDEGYTPKNLHRLFDRWMEVNPPSVQPWKKVLDVETAFVSRAWLVTGTMYDVTLTEIPLADVPAQIRNGDDVVQLIVRPDAVVLDAAGMIRYVDTKTTGWSVTDASWLRNLRLSFQTQLYADAVVQKYGDQAMYGGWINACEIKKLPGSSQAAPKMKLDGTPAKIPPCPTHKRPYAECGVEHMKSVMQECLSDPGSIAYALALAKNAATTFVKLHRQHVEFLKNNPLDSVRFDLTHEAWGSYPLTNIPVDGIANEKCRFCPAAEWCDSNRVLGALPSFMSYDPWPVETGMREHAA